jgi:CRP-like cAMP-binding protein
MSTKNGLAVMFRQTSHVAMRQGADRSLKVSQRDVKALPSELEKAGVIVPFPRAATVFAQGDLATTVFYIVQGRVQLSVLSRAGKLRIIAILGRDDLFGEACLAGHSLRHQTATAITDCLLVKLEQHIATRLIQDRPEFALLFMARLISRSIQCEDNLVGHLFNSCEKRLARTLLMLSQFEMLGSSEAVIADINQETLAQLVGTTRSRVNRLLNKFRRCGMIDYGRVLKVNSSLRRLAVDE